MKVTVLGSGTSTGVPVPGCNCAVCQSASPKNKRFRTSILLSLSPQDGADRDRNILIDTSPDLRMQALTFGVKRVDAVIYTHVHADHVNGIDDLRSFNFVQRSTIPVYATEVSAQNLRRMFGYAFTHDSSYEGGAPPRLSLQTFEPYEPLHLFGVQFIPLVVMHGKMEVMAYRIGKFAYATDCALIPDRSKELLRGLECLILDGLRVRPHPTHFTHEQAVQEIEDLKPKQAFLTHISHEVEHEETNKHLSTLTTIPVELAYDGLSLSVN